jgi:hypothetical protein
LHAHQLILKPLREINRRDSFFRKSTRRNLDKLPLNERDSQLKVFHDLPLSVK